MILKHMARLQSCTKKTEYMIAWNYTNNKILISRSCAQWKAFSFGLDFGHQVVQAPCFLISCVCRRRNLIERTNWKPAMSVLGPTDCAADVGPVITKFFLPFLKSWCWQNENWRTRIIILKRKILKKKFCFYRSKKSWDLPPMCGTSRFVNW